MLVCIARGEDRNWCCPGIIAQQTPDGIQGYGLAIGAPSVHEEQCMLLRAASKAIAHHALQKRLQLDIASRYAIQKSPPTGTLTTRPSGRELCEVLLSPMHYHFPASKIYRSLRRVKQPGIGIPLLGRSSVASIGLNQALNGSDGDLRR